MNLLDLFVKVDVDDQASGKVEGIGAKITSKLGNAVKAVGKIAAGATLAAGAGALAITKSAVESYASYEQLVGGVDKLYQGASDKLQKYAQQAYKTSGMSANQYMEQATSFSAALINSLGGDYEKAAEQTDKAMRLMSDNVNTFGSDMGAVQYAIQGLSRENYTMLDNLKLGYAGTKQGMEELIKDAEEYAKKVKGMDFESYAKSMEKTGLSTDELRKRYDELTNSTDLTMGNFSDMVDAIDIIQEKQNIWGTTSKEAMTTIEGSISMTRAAWENFLTAIGSGDEGLIQSSVMGLVQGIFGTWDDEAGKRVGGIINNVAPVVQRVGDAILHELPSVASTIGYQFVELLLTAFGNNLNVADVMSGLEDSMQTASERFGAVLDGLGAAWDTFTSTVDMGNFSLALTMLKDIGEQLWGFVEENVLPNMPAIGEALGVAVNFIMELTNTVLALMDVLAPFLPVIIGAVAAVKGFMALQGIIALFTGLGGTIASLTTIVTTFGGPIATVAAALGGWPVLIAAVVGALVAFIATNEEARQALLDAWDKVVTFFRELPSKVKGALGNLGNMLKSAGRSIIQGFLNGLKEKFADVKEWVGGIGSWIADHKGPKQYDLGLLVDNGAWIMQSLQSGLEKGFEGKVKPYVEGMADKLQSAVSFDLASPTYSIKAVDARQQQQAVTTVRDDAVIGILTAILNAIPEEVTLDSRALVGALAPDMNRALGAL